MFIFIDVYCLRMMMMTSNHSSGFKRIKRVLKPSTGIINFQLVFRSIRHGYRMEDMDAKCFRFICQFKSHLPNASAHEFRLRDVSATNRSFVRRVHSLKHNGRQSIDF